MPKKAVLLLRMSLWMWELKKMAGSKNIGEMVWELSRVKSNAQNGGQFSMFMNPFVTSTAFSVFFPDES